MGTSLARCPSAGRRPTVSLTARAAGTSSTSRSTRLADAMPACVAVAVHAWIRLLSSTWVAAITATRCPSTSVVKGAKVVLVPADADDEAVGLRVLHRQALGQTVGAVVEAVVVGHARRRRSRPIPACRRPSGALEGELLVGASDRDDALEVPDRQVGAFRRTSPKGPTAVGGVGVETGAERALEVHVAGERDGDGLAAPEPVGHRRGAVVGADVVVAGSVVVGVPRVDACSGSSSGRPAR